MKYVHNSWELLFQSSNLETHISGSNTKEVLPLQIKLKFAEMWI